MRLISTLLAAGLLISPLAIESVQASQTTTRNITGTVESVDVLTSSYVRKTPSNERVCHTEELPVYSEAEQGDELGGLIVGGLIGSAVGNAVTDKDGAGTAGAIAGALLGREHAKSHNKPSRIIGYRQQEVCEVRTVVREERIEEITGYRLGVDIGGETITVKTSRSYDQGDTITLRMQTTYSAN